MKYGDGFITSETGHLIIAKFRSPGLRKISRWKMLEPTGLVFGRDVLWSHPAFAENASSPGMTKSLFASRWQGMTDKKR